MGHSSQAWPGRLDFRSSQAGPGSTTLDKVTCEPNPELISVECGHNSMTVQIDQSIFGPSGDEVKLAFADTAGKRGQNLSYPRVKLTLGSRLSDLRWLLRAPN